MTASVGYVCHAPISTCNSATKPLKPGKPIEATLVTAAEADYFKVPLELDEIEGYSAAQIDETIARLEFEMREHAKKFEFEKAAELRDRIKYLRERELQVA